MALQHHGAEAYDPLYSRCGPSSQIEPQSASNHRFALQNVEPPMSLMGHKRRLNDARFTSPFAPLGDI
jgi:hypothetical protein